MDGMLCWTGVEADRVKPEPEIYAMLSSKEGVSSAHAYLFVQ